jgi:hypothetical protein
MSGNRYYGRPADASGGSLTLINIAETHPDYVAFPSIPQTETAAATPVQNSAYFTYVGRWPIGSVFNFVVLNMTQIGGQQPTEVGFFISDSAPNRAPQQLFKIASTASFESITSGTGVKRNFQPMNATLFTDCYLWCGYRHSGNLGQPIFSTLTADFAEATHLFLNSSPAFSSTTNFNATLNGTALTGLGMRGERYPIT